MLPDYTQTKAEVRERLEAFLRARHRFHLGPLSRVPSSRVFEGDTQAIVRSTGEVEEVTFRESKSAFTVADAEVPHLTLDRVLSRLDGAAAEVAQQQARGMYETIAEAVDKVGNVVSGEGKQFSAEKIVETLTKIQIDFAPNGTPLWPQIHIHPNLEGALVAALERLETDPGLRKQMKQLVTDKREAWRAREASRRLVG